MTASVKIIILSSFLLLVAFTGAAPITSAQGDASSSQSYRYLFENERFTIPLQEVTIDGHGRGSYRYKRKEMDEITLDFTLSPRVLAEIRSLFRQSGFIDSNENYQHKKDFSHLGTITLTLREAERTRTARFNFTDHPLMLQLVRIFRGLVIQESRIFEIETVRETDPISTPAQLRFLESELKSKSVADPERFRPILLDMRNDESVPLIARNHAERLLQMISKK
jgi:hypothetical protein